MYALYFLICLIEHVPSFFLIYTYIEPTKNNKANGIKSVYLKLSCSEPANTIAPLTPLNPNKTKNNGVTQHNEPKKPDTTPCPIALLVRFIFI